MKFSKKDKPHSWWVESRVTKFCPCKLFPSILKNRQVVRPRPSAVACAVSVATREDRRQRGKRARNVESHWRISLKNVRFFQFISLSLRSRQTLGWKYAPQLKSYKERILRILILHCNFIMHFFAIQLSLKRINRIYPRWITHCGKKQKYELTKTRNFGIKIQITKLEVSSSQLKFWTQNYLLPQCAI